MTAPYAPGCRALCRALSAVLRGRASIKGAAWLHRVPVRALRRLVRAGRMPW